MFTDSGNAAESAAREYLSTHLGTITPLELRPAGRFEEGPLEGEGAVVLYEFELESGESRDAACTPERGRHFVAVGETTPNHFPAYGLAADDGYSVHVGTRFLLEAELNRLDPVEEPAGAREQVRGFVQGCNPAARLGEDKLVLLFRCADQHFAVYEIEIGERRMLCIGGDLPHGFYDPELLPPQVALRLHLGRVIREEARREREAPRRPQR